MYDDIEADYWREIFVHLQHKNMVRIGAERLTLENSTKAFERFENAHPEITAELSSSESFITWEIFVTDNIKLRLFIQNQIKGSLLQKNNGDLVKIADGKFPNNPFPEIEEFISNKNNYLKELHKIKENNLHTQKKQKLLYEFMKANLINKFSDKKDVIWTLNIQNEDFILSLQADNESKTIKLDSEKYISQISKL